MSMFHVGLTDPNLVNKGLCSWSFWHISRSSAVHGLRRAQERLQQIQGSAFRCKAGESLTEAVWKHAQGSIKTSQLTETEHQFVTVEEVTGFSPTTPLFICVDRMLWNISQWQHYPKYLLWSQRTRIRWCELACKTSIIVTVEFLMSSHGHGGMIMTMQG